MERKTQINVKVASEWIEPSNLSGEEYFLPWKRPPSPLPWSNRSTHVLSQPGQVMFSYTDCLSAGCRLVMIDHGCPCHFVVVDHG